MFSLNPFKSPSTQHPAPSTQHPAPSTQHPAPSTQLDAPLLDHYKQVLANEHDIYKIISEKITGLSTSKLGKAREALEQLRTQYPHPTSLADLITKSNEENIDSLITLHKLGIINLHATDTQTISSAIHSAGPSNRPPNLEKLNAIEIYCQGALPKPDASDSPFRSSNNPQNSQQTQHQTIIAKLVEAGISVHGHTKNSHSPLSFALNHADQADMISALLSHGADPFHKSYQGKRNVFSQVTHQTQTSSIDKLLEKFDSSSLDHHKILCKGAFASDSPLLFNRLPTISAQQSSFTQYLAKRLATKSFEHIGTHGASYIMSSTDHNWCTIDRCIRRDDATTLNVFKKTIINQARIFENTVAAGGDFRNENLNLLLLKAISDGAVGCVRSLLQNEKNSEGKEFQLLIESPLDKLGEIHKEKNTQAISRALLQHMKSTDSIAVLHDPNPITFEERKEGYKSHCEYHVQNKYGGHSWSTRQESDEKHLNDNFIISKKNQELYFKIEKFDKESGLFALLRNSPNLLSKLDHEWYKEIMSK